MARFSASVLALACAAAGCGSIANVNKRSAGAIENGAFKPSLPPADSFGPNPKYTCPGTSLNGAVQSGLNDKLKGKAVPEPDGRLCAIAETLLSWPGASGDTPPDSIRTFLTNYFGLTSSIRPPILATFETDDSRMLTDPLVQPVATFAEDAKVPRYGLVSERVKKGPMTAADVAQQKSTGGTKVVIVLQDQNFELLAPLPRRLAPGGSAQLNAKVIGPVSKVKAEIVDVSGKLQTVKAEGETLTAQLSCGDKPGKILVQVAGEREGVDLQLANFTVACGGELATSAPMPGKEAGPSTPEADEKRILELINKERTGAGLPPLENNDALAGISRQVSTDRAQGKATTSTQLLKALRDADIGSPVILESAIQAYNGENAFERLSNIASERATLLNAEANQIGIGVAKGPMVGKVPTVIMTALLIKQVPPADPAEIKSKLYEAMQQRRKDARAEALKKDATLEQVAQKYADAAAAGSGQVPPEKQSEILAPLYKQSMTVNQVGGFVPDAKGAVEVAQQPSVVGKGNLVGVGVALGRSPQFGKNAPFVVVFFGTRHQAPKAAGKPRPKK